MFKVIGRILIILLVAVIVAGGIYLLVQNGSSNTLASAPDQQFESRAFDRNLGGNFAPPNGFRERGHDGEFSIGHGLGGMVGTVLKMGVIVLLVLLVQKRLANLNSRRTAQTG